jgi:uncharacterized iron-regulated membrane protein
MDNSILAPGSAPADPGKDFKLERYKYILQQQNALNENLHKYLTLYQTLTTAIISAIVAVMVGWPKLNIGAYAAKLGIRGLTIVLVLLGVFVVLSLLSGVASWMDYRREEVDLLKQAVGPGSRSDPKYENLWRWYETYTLAFVLVSEIAMVYFIEWWIMPTIQ